MFAADHLVERLLLDTKQTVFIKKTKVLNLPVAYNKQLSHPCIGRELSHVLHLPEFLSHRTHKLRYPKQLNI